MPPEVILEPGDLVIALQDDNTIKPPIKAGDILTVSRIDILGLNLVYLYFEEGLGDSYNAKSFRKLEGKNIIFGDLYVVIDDKRECLMIAGTKNIAVFQSETKAKKYSDGRPGRSNKVVSVYEAFLVDQVKIRDQLARGVKVIEN